MTCLFFLEETWNNNVYVYYLLILCHFRTVTNSTILLCVWHVHRAWLKNVGNKVKGSESKSHIFRALWEIMHSCHDDESVKNALARFFDEFSEHKSFLKYFNTTWLANNKICKFFCSWFLWLFCNAILIVIIYGS